MTGNSFRAAFEHWYSNDGAWPASVERRGDGYKLASANAAWGNWQACAAALGVAVPQPDLTDDQLNEVYRQSFRLIDSRLVGDQLTFARALIALDRKVRGVMKPCEQLGMAVVDAIAEDGCRNAAGGIYATRVQEFAMEVQRAFAQQNRLHVRGLMDPDTQVTQTGGGHG